MAKTKPQAKPKQEMKTSNYIGLLAVISILVILVGGLAAKSLGSSFILNQKVFNQKNSAQKTLAADVGAVKSITKQYKTLGGQTQMISDALPTTTDIPGLANAIEVMAGTSGSQMTDVSATNAAAASAPASGTGGTASNAPIPLPVNITATTSYDNLGHFLSAIESSARPIAISDIQLTGTNAKLNVIIDATTYYQNPATFSVTKETIK